MILVAYGTRPEIIKLFPVVRELQSRGVPFRTLFTGQQIDLFNDVKDLMPEPDFTFSEKFTGREKHGTLAQSFVKICVAADSLFHRHQFTCVVVQGDTTTASAIAQMAFFNKIPVAHVEAGLRTFDLANPYPEEANRSVIGQIATVNFAPTPRAQKNLEAFGARNVHLTGNTIVDAVRILSQERGVQNPTSSRKVLATLHRRENHEFMAELFGQLDAVALAHPDFDFVLPIHPNPNVFRHRSRITSANFRVIAPVGYLDMLRMVAGSAFVITDSGGLQEECACFGKRVLIVRETTERPEVVEAELGRLVGRNIIGNIEWAMSRPAEYPAALFGDGYSAQRIVETLASSEIAARNGFFANGIRS